MANYNYMDESQRNLDPRIKDPYYATPYREGNGTWFATYNYGYGTRWVSGWEFKPDPPAAATPQPASKPSTSENVVKTKKPKPVLGETQTQAEAGDTIPIVFCCPGVLLVGEDFYESNIGGTWVQPALVKSHTANGFSTNVFAISQGKVEGFTFLNTYRMWIGNRNLKFSIGITDTVAEDYIDAASSELSPNTCPLFYSNNIGILFRGTSCDPDVTIFMGNTLTTSGGTVRRPDIENNYHTLTEYTRGTLGPGGTNNTDNSVIVYDNSDIEVYDTLTGNDVTAAYWSYLGISPTGTFTYINAIYSGGSIIGGISIGNTITRIDNNPPTGSVPYSTGPVVFTYGSGTLNNQINPAFPANTAAVLLGVSQSWEICPYIDRIDPPTTKNFTNYSDITWLSIADRPDASLWDPNNGDFFDFGTTSEIPTDFKQLSVWCTTGVSVDLYSEDLVAGEYINGPSSYFVDLAMHMFTLMKRANGANTDSLAAPIDTSNLRNLAIFNFSEELFFNGVIDQSVNVIEYITRTAPYFFMSFISIGGQYKLKSSVPVKTVSAHEIVIDVTAQTSTTYTAFDEGKILPGSFQKKYFNAEDQRAICVSILWRDADPTKVSTQQTTVVRYPETATDAPTVQFDMTDFCTTSIHAAKYAKYELARRRYSTHAISFATQLGNAFGLEPTDIIKIQRQRINSRGDNRTEIGHYQITKLTHTEEGVTLIEAAYFPLNASNIYTINNEIVNGTFTIT
jgi:hypothetical protein